MNRKILTGIFLAGVLVSVAPRVVAGNRVEIRREEERFHLYVNGESFRVKGAGVGLAFGSRGENYLRLAEEMGANAVRTWGVDQGDKKYLDEAARRGLYVSAGMWLNPVADNGTCSYITDKAYQDRVRSEILGYVEKFKDHPAILFWNVGNEVFQGTHSEEEKVGFARFLNALIEDIKEIDPDHPTVYASAGLAGLDYIVKYVPALDIFGVNSYGGVSSALTACRNSGLNRPVLLTELGPTGFWDLPQDDNGLPRDQNDLYKASLYRSRLEEAAPFLNNILLGTFIFHVGETTQDSYNWWNVNVGNYKRASFWEIRKTYAGEAPEDFPRIKSFSTAKAGPFSPGEWVDVNLTVVYPRPKDLNFEYFFSTSERGVLQYYVQRKIDADVVTRGANTRVRAPSDPGLYRFYAVVKSKNGSAASQNISLLVGR